MAQFTHLHVHSCYSLLDGMSAIKGLVDKCVANGMKAMALTDHGNMFGCKEFFDYAKKKNGEFKPILGCEVYVARNTLFSNSFCYSKNSSIFADQTSKKYKLWSIK